MANMIQSAHNKKGAILSFIIVFGTMIKAL
jgi:hypothetical protein